MTTKADRGVCIASAMQHAHGGANGFLLTPGEAELVCLALIHTVGQYQAIRRDAALGAKVRDAVGPWASDPGRIAWHEEMRVTDEGEPDRYRDVFVVDEEQVDILGAIATAFRDEADHG